MIVVVTQVVLIPIGIFVFYFLHTRIIPAVLVSAGLREAPVSRHSRGKSAETSRASNSGIHELAREQEAQTPRAPLSNTSNGAGAANYSQHSQQQPPPPSLPRSTQPPPPSPRPAPPPPRSTSARSLQSYSHDDDSTAVEVELTDAAHRDQDGLEQDSA